MFFNGALTLKVIYPKTIAPLLDENLLKDNGMLTVLFMLIMLDALRDLGCFRKKVDAKKVKVDLYHITE